VSGYCDIALGHEWHGPYHDTEYGFPTGDESALFERLILEINQAGLSWLTILRKREGFVAAFDGFDVDAVARYGTKDRERLLSDASIIRNRLKVDAAIHNAQCILDLRDSHGGFADWLEVHHPLSKDEWGQAVQKNIQIHRWRDHGRIPDEHGISARRTSRGMPRVCPDWEGGAGLDASSLIKRPQNENGPGKPGPLSNNFGWRQPISPKP
jgi:DNA-3-methyladenine glycosylase I